MKRRSNRFLTWTIAISLAAHAVVIYWAQGMNLSYADVPLPPDPIRIDHPKRIPPPPTVIVTPKPVVPMHPQQTTQHHPPTPPTSTDNRNTTTDEHPGAVAPPGPPDVGPPQIGPTGPVEPTETPAPSCSAPEIAAHVLTTATAETPEVAQEQGITGTTQVEVSIDPDGKITATSIYRSSGSQALDNAALAAARQSTYKADVRDCEAVAGSYLFTVVFQ
jgi:protein TonB